MNNKMIGVETTVLNKKPLSFERGYWFQVGGGRGIRTPGSVTYNSFQDCRIKPLCHSSEGKIRRIFNKMDKKNKSRPVFVNLGLIHKLFFVALFALCFNNTANAGMKAYLKYATFYSAETGPYIETYLTVIGNSVLYQKNSNGKFQAFVDLDFAFVQHDSVKTGSRTKLYSSEVDDTTQLLPNFMDVQRFAIPNGLYDFEISASDHNKQGAQPFKAKQSIEINYTATKVHLSDIAFLESYTKTTTPNKLTRSGYDLLPYVSTFYPANFNKFTFYAEIYNTDKVIAADEKYVVSYFIESKETQKIMTGFAGYAIQKPAPVNVLLTGFDITKLPTGNYNSVVEVKNKDNTVLCRTTAFFQRQNKDNKINYDDIASIYTGNSFVEKYTNNDTLRDLIRSLRPISTPAERTYSENQVKENNLENMQKYFLNFWKSRNELLPQSEWLTYYAEVKKVNKAFGTLNLKGYDSDRGRVYLQYGPPNTRVVSDNEPSAYPYEIWQYNKLDNQTNRRFVFCNKELATNEYRLIHSDARGELANQNWQQVVSRFGNAIIDSDVSNMKNVDIFGNRINQNLKDTR